MILEKLKEVQSEWKTDSFLDQHRIDEEIVKIPRLHQKYLDLLTDFKFKVFKKQAEFLKLKGARSRYFSGVMSKEELEKYGWLQYQGKTPLKSELERLLEVDDVLLSAEEHLYELKACFEYVESVMGVLKWRGSELKTLVDYKKWIDGN